MPQTLHDSFDSIARGGLRAPSFIRAFPAGERKVKHYSELTPLGRGRPESRVGHGSVENPGTAGSGSSWVLFSVLQQMCALELPRLGSQALKGVVVG